VFCWIFIMLVETTVHR